MKTPDTCESTIRTRTFRAGLAVLLSVLATSPLHADPLPPAPKAELELARSATVAIADFNRDQKLTQPQLRIVYFTPADAEPQKDHRERLTRVMVDISAFLGDEMRRHGFACEGLPLEMEDGLLKLYEVKGSRKAAEYTYESGDRTEEEMRAALKGTVDFDTECVLVLYSMCRKNADGSYFFHAPYYGKGGSGCRWGLCHAADCELLDPTLLADTSSIMKYTEHYGSFRKSLADFNTAYLGGIAHELGHGLGLPHDSESSDEQAIFGHSLMGGGNLTYRRERWSAGAGQGSFLTLASCLRLASHPLFAGASAERFRIPQAAFAGMELAASPHALHLSGTLSTDIPSYAVIAYVDPASRPSDYDAVPFAAAVNGENFQIDAVIPEPGKYELRIAALHCNGAVTTREMSMKVGADSVADTKSLKNLSPADDWETAALSSPRKVYDRLTDAFIAAEPLPAEREKLRHLKRMIENNAHPVVVAAESPEPRLWLSDAAWTEASVGWGEPARDQMGGAPSTGLFIRLGGEYVAKGLYAHAPSRYVFDLQKKWKTLEAVAGLKDGDPRNAVFVIKGDGRELYRSKLLDSSEPTPVKVSIEGVATLELIVEKGTGLNGHAWAVWGSPELSR